MAYVYMQRDVSTNVAHCSYSEASSCIAWPPIGLHFRLSGAIAACIIAALSLCTGVLSWHCIFETLRLADKVAVCMQSLHTTVLPIGASNDLFPLEVQIRTADMHHLAEFGIAGKADISIYLHTCWQHSACLNCLQAAWQSLSMLCSGPQSTWTVA